MLWYFLEWSIALRELSLIENNAYTKFWKDKYYKKKKKWLSKYQSATQPFLESSRNAPHQECCITKTENNERGGEVNSGGDIP